MISSIRSQWHNDDSVAIFIDVDGTVGDSEENYDERTFQMGFRPMSGPDRIQKGFYSPPVNSSILAEWLPTPAGYSYEIAIPWSYLNSSPGGTPSIEVHLNDDDPDGTSPSARNYQLSWATPLIRLGKTSVFSHQSGLDQFTGSGELTRVPGEEACDGIALTPEPGVLLASYGFATSTPRVDRIAIDADAEVDGQALSFGVTGGDGFQRPEHAVVRSDGVAWVIDRMNRALYRIKPDATTTLVDTGSLHPHGVALSPGETELYVTGVARTGPDASHDQIIADGNVFGTTGSRFRDFTSSRGRLHEGSPLTVH